MKIAEGSLRLLVRRLHLKCPVRLFIQIPECLPDLLVIYTVSEEKTVTANNIVSIVDCHKSKQSRNIFGTYTKDICKIAMEIKGYVQWHSLPSEYWSECCNKNDSYDRLADTAFLIGYRYSVIYSSIFIDIMISIKQISTTR